MKCDLNPKHWTFGAELEWSDYDRRPPLPKGFKFDERDVTMVNSNGIAVDPKGRSYHLGGEINTPPTVSISSQRQAFEEALHHCSGVVVNYRSNLHCHVRIPGLIDDLTACKRIQNFLSENLGYLDTVEPIPKPQRDSYSSSDAFEGAMRRYRRRKVSHHKSLTERQYTLQSKARSIGELFAVEAPKNAKTGSPMFHLAPRCAVNLRQLLETDTIEFRHFPGTLSPERFEDCLRWCRDFLINIFEPSPIAAVELFQTGRYELPKFRRYVHWMEVGFSMTVLNGTNTREEVERNIQRILSDPNMLRGSYD